MICANPSPKQFSYSHLISLSHLQAINLMAYQTGMRSSESLEADLEPDRSQGCICFDSKPRTPRRMMPVLCPSLQNPHHFALRPCIRFTTCKSHNVFWVNLQ